ncbi:hypothetical protein HHI36_010305 [Cryptolaemus montrouzieri]|uniref:Uncharacterized protein n=1 Tax=Cryptolaemus montrouzieri TaxID=559131 RepID=A0ABD2MIE3_9CUCU
MEKRKEDYKSSISGEGCLMQDVLPAPTVQPREEKKSTTLKEYLPTKEPQKPIQKPERKGGTVAPSELAPSLESEDIIEKASEFLAIAKAENPFAFHALKSDHPAKLKKARVAHHSEQKIEASPVAEEALPQLKSAEKLIPSAPENVIEKKEALPENKERDENEKLEEIYINLLPRVKNRKKLKYLVYL